MLKVLGHLSKLLRCKTTLNIRLLRPIYCFILILIFNFFVCYMLQHSEQWSRVGAGCNLAHRFN